MIYPRSTWQANDYEQVAGERSQEARNSGSFRLEVVLLVGLVAKVSIRASDNNRDMPQGILILIYGGRVVIS